MIYVNAILIIALVIAFAFYVLVFLSMLGEISYNNSIIDAEYEDADKTVTRYNTEV